MTVKELIAELSDFQADLPVEELAENSEMWQDLVLAQAEYVRKYFPRTERHQQRCRECQAVGFHKMSCDSRTAWGTMATGANYRND